MLTRKLLGFLVCMGPAIWAGAVFAEDFTGYSDESELRKVVRAIPASDKAANASGYARLLALNPNNDLYWSKYERYSGRNEAGMFAIVRRIPASNRAANAAGYARLLAINPDNKVYRAKFEKYSSSSKRPGAVNSVSDLRSFLAGSWCVIDEDPTYVAGPHVKKLVILADGNYSLFSKPASDLSWNSARERGKLSFGEGRHTDTGEKYYYAISKEFGMPKLVVDANGRTVMWKGYIEDLGEATRESCGRFE